MTLVDEDTKSILTDNANRAIEGNQAMHVTIVWCANLLVMQMVPSGGQICNQPSGGQIWNQYASGASGGKIGDQCKWCHLVAKFETNSRSFTEINFKLF